MLFSPIGQTTHTRRSESDCIKYEMPCHSDDLLHAIADRIGLREVDKTEETVKLPDEVLE